MSWRTVIVTGCAKLDYKMDYLVVRKKDETYRIHLSEISNLIIESTGVSLTTMLMCELVKKKVKVVFCDEQHNPSSELTPYYGCHDTSVKIRYQIAWKNGIKSQVWTEIVSEKIRQQMEHLYDLDKIEQANLLGEYIKEIKIGDTTNREGHAAKVYFNGLFGLDFTRSEDNPINAALNYGYSIILACFNREIVANGYMTQLGLFHENQFNKFNLASDFMEPFRILVDRKVYNMKMDCFEHDEKMEMYSILNDQVYIDGKLHYVNNAIKIYCKSLFDALNNRDISLIRMYKNEL